MIVKKILLGKLVLLLALSLSVWLSYIPDQPYHLPTAATAQQNFHVIEFNDQGQPHLPAQWQALQARITQTYSGPAPELLIFVHGWHHSAKPDDENFVAFEQFYQQMSKRDPQRNLLGLYIGWRGDKFDPLFLDGSTDANSSVEPLDFPTIFQRKRVAKKIGQTGLSQLLDQLDLLVEQRKMQRYVLVGHSLGGAMALHASKDRVKQAIEQQKDNPNLFIFLNPAVHAKEYQPLDSLLSLDRQKPSMVVLQSKGDFAVKEAFNYLKDGERAVGNSWAITHDIDRCPNGNCQTPFKMPAALLAHDQKPGCMMTLERTGWKVRARLQARRTVQTCADANMQAVWVLAVSDDIISGHNGILTEGHAGALSEVMGMIDLYRNQLPAGHVAEATAATAADRQVPAAAIETETFVGLSALEPAAEQSTAVIPAPVAETSREAVSDTPPGASSPPVVAQPVSKEQ